MPADEPVKKNPVKFALAALIGGGSILNPTAEAAPGPLPAFVTPEERRDLDG